MPSQLLDLRKGGLVFSKLLVLLMVPAFSPLEALRVGDFDAEPFFFFFFSFVDKSPVERTEESMDFAVVIFFFPGVWRDEPMDFVEMGFFDDFGDRCEAVGPVLLAQEASSNSIRSVSLTMIFSTLLPCNRIL